MRIVLYILAVLVFGSLFGGVFVKFYIQDIVLGDRMIGLGVLGLFFIWMPLFLFHRYNGRSVQGSFFIQRKEEEFNEKKE